jgi:hypothetical protein
VLFREASAAPKGVPTRIEIGDQCTHSGGMPDINATFTNNYGDSRQYAIWDLGRDPNSPPVIFNDYLDANQSTNPLAVHSNDFGETRVMYQRSDGPQQVVDNISDGDNVSME